MIFNRVLAGRAGSAALALMAMLPAAALWAAGPGSDDAVPGSSQGCVIVPGAGNFLQLRLYTNASPTAENLFNTVEVQSDGRTLIRGPRLAPGRAANSYPDLSLHALLVDGMGPELSPTNSMRLVADVSGAGWRYVVLDGTAAYRRILKEYRRGILWVEPDLFVLYDHATPREPARFKMTLHPPREARLDPVWGDWTMESTGAVLKVHSPAPKNRLRNWNRVESIADALFPGTVTLELSPTNRLARLEVLTIFAVQTNGASREYAFRLLEGNNAIGARVHRDGWPTLVAFKTDWSIEQASVSGFPLAGLVGVDVPPPPAIRRQPGAASRSSLNRHTNSMITP